MMQFGSDHSGWPGGQRLGVGDVEPGPADDAVAQRVDQVVGHDVATAGDVDQPGVILHQRQLVGADEPLRLRREGERQHDEVGAREGIRIPVGLEHVVDAVEVADVAAHDRQVAVPRLQQADERLGDPAAAEDRDPCAEQVAALGRRPLLRPGVRAHAAQPGQPRVRASSATGSA